MGELLLFCTLPIIFPFLSYVFSLIEFHYGYNIYVNVYFTDKLRGWIC